MLGGGRGRWGCLRDTFDIPELGPDPPDPPDPPIGLPPEEKFISKLDLAFFSLFYLSNYHMRTCQHRQFSPFIDMGNYNKLLCVK